MLAKDKRNGLFFGATTLHGNK